MKLMDLLQEKLEKKIGDEWVGRDGETYRLTSNGVEKWIVYKYNLLGVYDMDKHLEEIKEVWKPKIGHPYYSIITFGGKMIVVHDIYEDSNNDKNRISQNNFFKTEEEAKAKLEKTLGVFNEIN